jgi:hypothetical protein
MKTTTVRFTRNPQFTPASLSSRELSRIEWIVKAYFLRTYRPDAAVQCDPMRGDEALKDLSNWLPTWRWEVATGPDYGRRTRHQARLGWLLNSPDARKYFTSCWNYLLAIARRNGEVADNAKYTKAFYAERSYGYN